MLIEGLVDFLLNFFMAILSPLPALPAFPASLQPYLDAVKQEIILGMQILNVYVYGDAVQAMLAVTLIEIAFVDGYRVVMWIIKKIPLLGIE